ncbi:hypothetical protein J6590_075246 [Homalodisca vitripennis]|nr:hypothetical protein J6590_075246 [Homalodisca vitripennis]
MMPTQRPVSAAPTVTSLSRVPHTATEVTHVARHDPRAEQAHPCSRVKATELVSKDSQPKNLLGSVLGVRSEATYTKLLLRRQLMSISNEHKIQFENTTTRL